MGRLDAAAAAVAAAAVVTAPLRRDADAAHRAPATSRSRSAAMGHRVRRRGGRGNAEGMTLLLQMLDINNYAGVVLSSPLRCCSRSREDALPPSRTWPGASEASEHRHPGHSGQIVFPRPHFRWEARKSSPGKVHICIASHRIASHHGVRPRMRPRSQVARLLYPLQRWLGRKMLEIN